MPRKVSKFQSLPTYQRMLIVGVLTLCLFTLVLFTSRYFLNGTKEVPKSESSPVSVEVTKKSYLEKEGVTDFTNSNTTVREAYEKERSQHVSQYSQYIYVGHDNTGLYYLPVSLESEYKILKEKILKADPSIDNIKSFLPVTDILLKSLDSSSLKVGDLIVIGFQQDYLKKIRVVVSIDKGVKVEPQFDSIPLGQVDGVLTKLNDDYITVVGLIKKVISKKEFSDILSKLQQTRTCSLNVSNETKQWVSETNHLYFGRQTDCSSLTVVGYRVAPVGFVVNAVYLDQYYTSKDQDIVQDKYSRVLIETKNQDMSEKVYDHLKQQYPEIFY